MTSAEIAEKASEPKHTAFDDILRTDETPMKNTENVYSFYNRSARSEIKLIRSVIENALHYFPHEEIKELVSRIRSGDDVHFRSATFELLLHEALRKQGFTLYPHPTLSNGSTYKPDFLVTDPNGEKFYLEAVLSNEINSKDEGGEARKRTVFELLSKAPHENFMITLKDRGSPDSPPKGRLLKNAIHGWLDSLDPDKVQEQIDSIGLDSVTPFEWDHDGWDLQISPIPLKFEKRGKSSNLVGAKIGQAGWADNWRPIRNAIKFKGGKYGKLELPLIIAVNSSSFHLDRIDEMQALFWPGTICIYSWQ